MTFSDSCGRWSAAKEAKEGSEQRVSLLLRSVLFIFWYLVFCFKIILGIKYLTFYEFKVYWYLVGKIYGILVFHYPPLAGEGGCLVEDHARKNYNKTEK